MGIRLAHRRYSAEPDRVRSCHRKYVIPLANFTRRSSGLRLDGNGILNHDFESLKDNNASSPNG
jgi:hypothetical protein